MLKHFYPQNNPIRDSRALTETAGKKNPLVLIADSDNGKRGVLKNLCDLYDVAVLEAATGEEAVDLTVRARPNLILMNTKMPRLDGFEAARLIKTIQSLSRIPIIFLSNRTERVFRKKAFAAGGDGFHLEPLDLERLDGILENFLFQAV